MTDINNKDARLALIARYLDAETTVAEEALLAAYYTTNKADDDETAVAEMVLMEHADALLLSHEGEKEYDRIVNGVPASPRKKILHRTLWCGGIAAAIALLFTLNVGIQKESEPATAFNTVEIAGYMQQIMDLNMESVTSITASPVQECVLITVTLDSGGTKTFIMSKSNEKGSASLLAID